ncbi:putative metallo-beta-lactamase domain protein, partial [Aureobasidium melanogenum]
MAANEPTIQPLYERRTGTWQYLVSDTSTKAAIIIDPVLDYDPATQTITTSTADAILSLIKEKSLRVERILETHVHADHITAASYLQSRLSQEQGRKPLICIGKRIVQVQKLFGQKYQIAAEEFEGAFDKLLDNDESFSLGNLKVTALHLPGHTPDHLGYMIGDNVFCGDSILNTDLGTARADFPGGNASDLFSSGSKLLSLPDHVKVWTGHDYVTEERGEAVPFMTLATQALRLVAFSKSPFSPSSSIPLFNKNNPVTSPFIPVQIPKVAADPTYLYATAPTKLPTINILRKPTRLFLCLFLVTPAKRLGSMKMSM